MAICIVTSSLYGHCDRIHALALQGLGSIVDTAVGAQAVSESAGAEATLQAMLVHRANQHVQVGACAVLSGLCFSADVQGGVVESALPILEVALAHAVRAVRIGAIEAFSMLGARVMHAHAAQLQRENGVALESMRSALRTVLRVMKAHSADCAVQEHGCQAVAVSVLCVTAPDAGQAASLVIEALQRHAESELSHDLTSAGIEAIEACAQVRSCDV